MVRRFLSHIRQHDTHRQLVGRAGALAWRVPQAALDAVIVPASRPAANLDHAVTLARAAGCHLVVLCSRDTCATQVGELLTARGFSEATVVDVPSGYNHPLLTFTSSDLARGDLPGVNPNGDLSTKRNLGLLLARMAGWSRIFFMDDDVRDIGAADLSATVSMLGRYRSVGIRVTEFPDNSVVCHAHRLTGAPQDVFVSGSALAVNCDGATGFFPEIYNEDWLFFYDDARARLLGWSGRNATQLRYDPFAHRRRAEGQEFGDVLAEGLYALLHLGAGPSDATRAYWDDFLVARRKFLYDIVARAQSLPAQAREPIEGSVQTAMMCLMEIRPKMCEDYVRAWRGDLRAWKQREISRVPSVEAALVELGLPTAADGHACLGTPAATGLTVDLPAGPASIPQPATLGLLQGWGKPMPGRKRHRRSPAPVPGTAPDPPAWPHGLAGSAGSQFP